MSDKKTESEKRLAHARGDLKRMKEGIATREGARPQETLHRWTVARHTYYRSAALRFTNYEIADPKLSVLSDRSRIMFSMNRLSTEKRAAILGMLVEGNSLRATTRMAGCSINTVSKLLLDIGEACAELPRRAPARPLLQDRRGRRDLVLRAQQAAQRARGAARAVRLSATSGRGRRSDADSKLIPSLVRRRPRSRRTRDAFMLDLSEPPARPHPAHDRRPRRLPERRGPRLPAQHRLRAAASRPTARNQRAGQARYSPAVCTGTRTRVDRGDPDPARISTSYVERQNLTMRMGMRRFTRLTNGFSKKLDNHMAAIALHFMHYNFARTHKTLECTPAMAAGVADHRWSLTEIAGLLD